MSSEGFHLCSATKSDSSSTKCPVMEEDLLNKASSSDQEDAASVNKDKTA
jgi:hypothetical protein